MKKDLEKYNGFQECMLKDIVWKRWGYNIEFHFDYIWDSENSLRENLHEEKIVIVEFIGVQELTIKNSWNEANETNPERLDWGSGEISTLKIQDSEELLEPYQNRSVDYRHAAVLWESDRRIDVVFIKMKIYQGLHSVR